MLSQKLPPATTIDLAQIFLGEFLWEAIGVEVKPGIISLKRPSKPKDQEELGLTVELWWMLNKCWETDPDDRITTSDILNFLLYMWVSFLESDSLVLTRYMIQGLIRLLVFLTVYKRRKNRPNSRPPKSLSMK